MSCSLGGPLEIKTRRIDKGLREKFENVGGANIVDLQRVAVETNFILKVVERMKNRFV
jgi:hypothetical protein